MQWDPPAPRPVCAVAEQGSALEAALPWRLGAPYQDLRWGCEGGWHCSSHGSHETSPQAPRARIHQKRSGEAVTVTLVGGGRTTEARREKKEAHSGLPGDAWSLRPQGPLLHQNLRACGHRASRKNPHHPVNTGHVLSTLQGRLLSARPGVGLYRPPFPESSANTLQDRGLALSHK